MRVFWSVLACFICYFVSFGVTSDDKPIQTFVVPHSHMDVGWVYTIQVGFGAMLSASTLFILIILQRFIKKKKERERDLFCTLKSTLLLFIFFKMWNAYKIFKIE